MNTFPSDEVVEYWELVETFMTNSKQRKGQAMMNALFQFAPELYREILATEDDCFYRDDLVDKFLARVFP